MMIGIIKLVTVLIMLPWLGCWSSQGAGCSIVLLFWGKKSAYEHSSLNIEWKTISYSWFSDFREVDSYLVQAHVQNETIFYKYSQYRCW